jgi:hypothetical protein
MVIRLRLLKGIPECQKKSEQTTMRSGAAQRAVGGW